MRNIGQHRAEKDDSRDLGIVDDLEDLLSERLPAARRLSTEQKVQGSTGDRVRRRRTVDSDARPNQAASAIIIGLDGRPIELVVEIVLRVHLGQGVNVELRFERLDDAARRLSRVIPALERHDEHSTCRET